MAEKFPQSYSDIVSVITPVFNGEMFLGQCIDSVISQSYDAWELILVDDCSTDSSESIIRYYCDLDCRIRSYSLDFNSGAASARNKGVSLASGRFIAFLDCDDFWSPDFLAVMIPFLKSSGRPLACSGYWLQGEGEMLKPYKVPPTIGLTRMLLSNPISCLATVIDRTRLESSIYFPEHRQTHEDFHAWYKIISEAGVAAGCPLFLAVYRQSPYSLSSNKFSNLRDRFDYLVVDLSFNHLKAFFFVIAYGVFGFVKYFDLFSRRLFARR